MKRDTNNLKSKVVRLSSVSIPVNVNLTKLLALIMLIEGYEIIPLTSTGEVDDQYEYERKKGFQNYRITNIQQIERYFDEFKCKVGYFDDGKLIQLVPTNNFSEYFFYWKNEVKLTGRFV